MQIYETIIIAFLGIGAIAAIIAPIIRGMKTRGSCSAGLCSSCKLVKECINNDKYGIYKNVSSKKR